MNKQRILNAIESAKKAAKKHSPEILTGIGIAGMITTTIMAVKATPKALQLMEEREVEENRKLTKIERFKTTWKCYIPATAVGVTSIGCLIGANSVNLRRNAALAAAYTLSETALKEYQEKALEVVGEKKEQAIRDAVAKKKLAKTSLSEPQLLYTGHGDTLCFDALSGRYFKSDVEIIRRAIHELNEQMRTENYISLNDFYDAIDLEETKLGDVLGWNLEKDYIRVAFSSQLAGDNTPFPGTPCLVVDFRTPPMYDFNRGW